jgi:hypothetical protein
MKRDLVFPFFFESSLLLVVFLLMVNLISLGQYSYATSQQESLKVKVLHSPGFNLELPNESAK